MDMTAVAGGWPGEELARHPGREATDHRTAQERASRHVDSSRRLHGRSAAAPGRRRRPHRGRNGRCGETVRRWLSRAPGLRELRRSGRDRSTKPLRRAGGDAAITGTNRGAGAADCDGRGAPGDRPRPTDPPAVLERWSRARAATLRRVRSRPGAARSADLCRGRSSDLSARSAGMPAWRRAVLADTRRRAGDSSRRRTFMSPDEVAVSRPSTPRFPGRAQAAGRFRCRLRSCGQAIGRILVVRARSAPLHRARSRSSRRSRTRPSSRSRTPGCSRMWTGATAR